MDEAMGQMRIVRETQPTAKEITTHDYLGSVSATVLVEFVRDPQR